MHRSVVIILIYSKVLLLITAQYYQILFVITMWILCSLKHNWNYFRHDVLLVIRCLTITVQTVMQSWWIFNVQQVGVVNLSVNECSICSTSASYFFVNFSCTLYIGFPQCCCNAALLCWHCLCYVWIRVRTNFLCTQCIYARSAFCMLAADNQCVCVTSTERFRTACLCPHRELVVFTVIDSIGTENN